jgi:UDP-glucose 4-epimerase
MDIVPALHRLVHLPRLYGEVVNLGSVERISIRNLAERVREKVNLEATIRYVSYDVAFGPGFEDMRDREPDLRRARELIGFKAQFNLDRILADVIRDRKGVCRPRQSLLADPVAAGEPVHARSGLN